MRTYLPAFSIALILLACLNALPAEVNKAARRASQLYGRYCISCHGSDGRARTSKGKYGHARDLTDAHWQDDASDERIFNSIMNGRNVRGNMPSFSNKINQPEAESLVEYVRRLRK